MITTAAKTTELRAPARSLWTGKKSPFYDEWESQPENLRRRIMGERLDEYVRYAVSTVPFYKQRLSAYRPHDEQPLRKVPPMNSQELRELLPPKSDLLIADKDGGYNVFQSGGTTGLPKTTLFSHEELEGLILPNARGFHAVGLVPQDRVANLFAVGGLYMTFLHIHRMLQQYGCTNFPFSNHTPADFIHTVTRLFKINCIAGIASVALGCLRGMAKLGLDGIEIEKVYYGGEHIYEADKKELREKFGARIIAAPGYGTVDTWYIGYQCLECATGVFHAHDDQCYIEIADSETHETLPAGSSGMLYATPFPRRLTPIVRYQVGDRAAWIGEPCPCGRTTPLFKLLGRGDDVLRIGFDSVDYAYVQEVVSRVAGLSGAVQMEKKREEGRDRLILRVETEAHETRHKQLAQELNQKLVQNRPSLRKFIAEGSVWPLQVELLRPDSLPRNPRTGKLLRVIDAI